MTIGSFGLALLMSGLAVASPTPNAPQQEAEMQVQEVRGAKVRYRVEGEGRPVVFFHGMPSDHRQMLHTFEPIFADQSGWKRIYVDMPGMGQTPRTGVDDYDAMLDVAVGFVDAMAGDGPVAVVGASWGAYMVRGIAYHRADRLAGVMMSEPMVTEGERQLPEPRVLHHDPAVKAMLTPDEELWLKVAVVQTPQTLNEFRERIKPGLMVADHAFLGELRKTELSIDLDAPPSPIEAPTLIVTGRQDSITGYRDAWAFVEDYPRASFVVLDRAGHPVATEQSELFRALTEEWLGRVAESWPTP